MAFASSGRVFSVDGVVHLFHLGDTARLLCGSWSYVHSEYEIPTCLICIAKWSHPCSDVCLAYGSCENCDGHGAPP